MNLKSKRQVVLKVINDNASLEKLAGVIEYYTKLGVTVSHSGREILATGTMSQLMHLTNSLGLNRISVIVKAIEEDCQLKLTPFLEQDAKIKRETKF